MKNPYLIILQGRPATGKTTIGKFIANSLHIPFISRDVYKETMYDAFGDKNQNTVKWSQALGATSFEIVYLVLKQILGSGNSCVVETAWIPTYAEQNIRNLLLEAEVTCIQIYLYCNDDIRANRFKERADTNRHIAHMDPVRIESGYCTKEDKHPKLNISGHCIEIDTTDINKINLQKIVDSINTLL